MNSIEAIISLGKILPMPSEDTLRYGEAIIKCMNRIEMFTVIEFDFMNDMDIRFFTSASEEKIEFWYDYFSRWEEDIDTILEYLDDLRCKPC